MAFILHILKACIMNKVIGGVNKTPPMRSPIGTNPLEVQFSCKDLCLRGWSQSPPPISFNLCRASLSKTGYIPFSLHRF
jgi:hypothetical protein